MARSRKPEIMADAAYAIFKRPSREATGNFYIDDEVLAAEGITDLSGYRYGDAAEEDLATDLFV
jgi:citronellol/citronellal dehydrogenase